MIMDLLLNKKLGDNYTSQSQKIRVLTEHWVDEQMYCPNCGYVELEKYQHNKPVGDFFCKKCSEDYELKSKKSEFRDKITDGSYKTMIERLTSSSNPISFFYVMTWQVLR